MVQVEREIMAAVDSLKTILDGLSSNDGISVAGIVSRNGVPIVCNLPAGSQVDTFSTLSATIMGAGEVIFTGMGKEKPNTIFLSSPNGNMLCTPISQKSLLIIVGEKDLQGLLSVAENAKATIKEVLSNGQKA